MRAFAVLDAKTVMFVLPVKAVVGVVPLLPPHPEADAVIRVRIDANIREKMRDSS
jgi:hypothetical protein